MIETAIVNPKMDKKSLFSTIFFEDFFAKITTPSGERPCRARKLNVDFISLKKLSWSTGYFPPVQAAFHQDNVPTMKNLVDPESRRDGRRVFSLYPVLMVCASLIALVATYMLAISTYEVAAKTRGFSAIITVFLIAFVTLRLWQTRRSAGPTLDQRVSEGLVERGLLALEEANQFFGGSLKSADTFRLVASRLREMVPFTSITLFLLDETRTRLVTTASEGTAAVEPTGKSAPLDEGLAGKCLTNRRTEIEKLGSVAIPLFHDVNVFGVLQMCMHPDAIDTNASLYEAIGTRVSPLVLSAISFERSLSNALTDPTTDLPNERAFYLILENQIAEAQRNRELRPLTILAVDVRNFDEINQRFGHAAGDRVLNFVAEVIKDSLRQMDFFARSMDDEFLAILPTASKEISHDVIARVHTGFFGRKLKMSESESIEVELNIGWAAFGDDGETPGHLLTAARVRKEQMKTVAPNKVLWFPQEMVN